MDDGMSGWGKILGGVAAIVAALALNRLYDSISKGVARRRASDRLDNSLLISQLYTDNSQLRKDMAELRREMAESESDCKQRLDAAWDAQQQMSKELHQLRNQLPKRRRRK